MKTIYHTTICLLLLAISITPVLAEQPDNETLTLKIGTMDLPPYGCIDEHGKKRGIIYTMNQEIGIRSGMRYSNEVIPFSRMLYKLREGQLDLISSQPHKEALASGEKLAIQHKVKVIAVTKKGSHINSIEELKGKRMLYHQSASYSKLEGVPKEIYRVNNYQQMVRTLYFRSTYDAGVFSEPAFYYWAKQVGLDSEDFGNIIIIESELEQWIFVNRNLSTPIKERLKQIVNDIFNEGLYDKLINEIK